MIEQYMNPGQMEVMNIGARDNVIIAGRGFGKSIIHAAIILRNFQRMQGSSTGIVGATAKRVLTNTLPSMLQHWENWGYKRNVHYAIGIKPPQKWGWRKPLFEPVSYENVISFYTGAIGIIISQDRKGTSNSLSLDFLDIDEAKFVNFERLNDETFPANRGNVSIFGHHPYHHGMLVTSDMSITKKGRWFERYRQECDEELVTVIHSLVLEEWDIMRRIKMRGEPTAPEKSELKKIRLYLAQLRSKTLLYREYSTIWNLQVLGEEYVKRMKRDLPPLVFKTSILCERLDYAVDGFYPAFTDKVRYSAPNTAYLDSLGYNFDRLTHVDCRMDGDVDLSRQLLIAFDFNANINWMVVGQMDDKGTLRILKSFWVKYDRKLPELLDDFMKYYEYHHEKVVTFYYDNTAVGNNYALQNEDFHNFITFYLEDRGWFVNDVFIGRTMGHLDKMLLINRMLQGKANVRVMVNEENNEDLIVSITTAGVFGGKKDKRGEKLAETEEDRLEGRTDGSDAFDTLCIGASKFPQSVW